MINLNDFSGQKTTRTVAAPTTSLTDDQVEVIRQRLQAGERHNVFPNKFDSARPFRVSVQFDGRWHNFGTFGNLEVATCVAAVAAVQFYGKQANTGKFDAAAVQNHPEWISWSTDNAAIIEAATLKQRQG